MTPNAPACWPAVRAPGRWIDVGSRVVGLSRTSWLLLWVLVQVLVLGLVMADFSGVQHQVRMELETRVPETDPGHRLPAQDLLDTASLMTGPEFLGVELPTEFRRHLSFQEGQMVWFLLDRLLVDSAPLVRRAASAVPIPQESARIHQGLTDGVLSFLYDLGSQRDLAVHNWSGVVVRELQASPLLPWVKHLDFVVLSSLADSGVGGLGFVTDLNQGVLLILPPHDPDRLRSLQAFNRRPNAVVLPQGLHPLGPGLWALVLDAPFSSGHPAELDLVVERRDGRLALFSGSGLNRPLVALRRVRQELGRDVALYVGATGYVVGGDTSGLQAELARIQAEFPDLEMVPNGDTSLVAHGTLEAWLGPRYRAGSLGTRLRL